MKTKQQKGLILLRANIRKKKNKRYFVLTEFNIYSSLTLEAGLYIMHRCGLPLYAADGLNQASYVVDSIACYEKYNDEIVVALLYPKTRKTDSEVGTCMFPEKNESVHLSGLSGSAFNSLIETIIHRTDGGKRLKEEYVEAALQKARLSLIPKGWEVINEGNVEPGDRYLEEDRSRGYFTTTPAIVSWMSCDVSFSVHKPGTPVKMHSWDDSIIIRKTKKA